MTSKVEVPNIQRNKKQKDKSSSRGRRRLVKGLKRKLITGLEKGKELFGSHLFVYLLVIFLVGLPVFWWWKSKGNKPRRLRVANNFSRKAAVAYFTQKASKGCVVGITFGKPVVSCEQDKNITHYLKLSNLQDGKKYRLLVINDYLPFLRYLKKESKLPQMEGDNLPSAQELEIKETFRKKFLPVVENKQVEDKQPYLVKGSVPGNLGPYTIVYFSNFSSEKIVAVPVNVFGNFMVDLSSLLPSEIIRVEAFAPGKEMVDTISSKNLSSQNLVLRF